MTGPSPGLRCGALTVLVQGKWECLPAQDTAEASEILIDEVLV